MKNGKTSIINRKGGVFMGSFENYKFADLRSCCPDAITKLEQKLKTENEKEIILIAYEKN